LDPPDIDAEKSNRTSKSWKGKSIRLRCFATGLPAPRISWYKPTKQQITTGVNIVPGGSEVTVMTTADQGDYGQYKCRATNILGSDEHVINITQLFPPGVVTITTAEVEASSITVGWTKPADDGGLVVTAYKVEVSTKTPVITVNAHTIITGLKANTQYTVKVYAMNDAGYGNASVKFITTKKQGKPALPQLKLTIDQTNGLIVKLSWTKPDENGGEITNYTIYMKEDGSSKLRDIHNILDPELLEYEVKENLEYGKTYKFLVTAWNKYGESAKQEELAKKIEIPKEKTKTDPNKGKRTTNVDGESNAAVIPGVVGAVLFMLLVGIILGVIIIRKKGLLSKGFGRKSPSNRAAYDNDVDPDSANQQAAAAGLGGEDDGIPTYAAVDMTNKKKKKNDIPDYAVVDKTKKKRPGEIIYAELAEFNTAGSSAAAPRPITYTSTDYADITQFQQQEETEPTYANFPGRGKTYTDIQGLSEDKTFQV
ncbi:neural cell adhesion molecule 1-like, partial [Actinia tenebrosa]|uniref:Neural cell adhesion molecule 1-like n=1 Tax=Actinia tenebrosa TaxID=6105 RepID=A0A6P8IS82_ACTTE